MISQSRMKAVLQAYVDGLNAGDADAVIALFAPDAVIEDPVGSSEKRGDRIRSEPDSASHRRPVRRPRPDARRHPRSKSGF